MRYRKIIAPVIAFSLLLQTSAFASVLGNESIKNSSLTISSGAVLHSNSFFSSQSGVGLQSENYVEYKPNGKTVPVILSDTHLYGRRKVSEMASALISGGIYPVMMMNSDFFSLQTGVPMSHQVENGVLITKDSNTLDAIGINDDGTAFISPLKIDTTVTVGENTIDIYNFNKFRQPYAVYMLNDKFSTTTQANSMGVNVIIGSLSGEITLDSEITGKVEKIIESDKPVEIEKGKIVLTVDNTAPTEVYQQLILFNEGDEVTIKTTCDGDKRWKDAKYVLGCFGGRIIQNGEITSADDPAAPRSAFGIKKDGTLVFYTIDGRQTGHSYGVRLQTLAKRLKELGCVDAVNLDGGGSTGIGTIYPGNSNFSIINKPSDGSERKVSTFIGLLNLEEANGNAERLFIYPYSGNYLSGATQTFNVLATDSAYRKAKTPSDLVFTMPDGTESKSSSLIISGDGEVKVSVKGQNATGEVTLNCYETPADIVLSNQDTKKSITTLNIKCGDSINLAATAWVGNKKLIGDDSCFVWSADESIGNIDSNGYFTATDEPISGKITVGAGEFKKDFKVNVTSDKKSYTGIGFEYIAPGQVEINFQEVGGVGIKEENIEVKVDGKEIDAPFEDNKINIVFADNMTHKINVTAVNNASLTTVANYTVNGIDYENKFTDTKGHWAEKYISYMNNMGVVNGSNDNGQILFRPGSRITRAEFAVMCANFLGIDVSKYADKTIDTNDVSIPFWAENHIKALIDLGIMQGRQVGDYIEFQPGETISRAEAVTAISRTLPKELEVSGKLEFTDADTIADWAKDAFKTVHSLGVINGYEDGSIRPLGHITRAEAVKIFYEIY